MTKSKKSSNLMTYAGTFGALVILCVVLAIASPNFFKYSNMMSILKQTSFNALVSTGMLLCLITAGIDLPANGQLTVTPVVSNGENQILLAPVVFTGRIREKVDERRERLYGIPAVPELSLIHI